MPALDFANANLGKIVEQLTTDEAILLTVGVGVYNTYAIPRLHIPSIKTGGAPNGIRGSKFFMSTPAKCLPTSTALAATWDTELVQEIGLKVLAAEAKRRAVSVVLAPTCNIQRNPLGGRSFESFSEDPILSGMVAASYINGLQSGGIGATIKHFTANDQEDDRRGCDAIISERALREIYLMPFMLAQKYAKPWALMTAYNSVNGLHCSENPHLIQDILRNEWKYTGLIMSDWFGTYGVAGAINAGVDLEMPGINPWRTLDKMNKSINCRKITLRTVKERAKKVLELAQCCARACPEILDGDGVESKADDDDTDRALLRKIAAESIVLLKNDTNLLPLKARELKRVAIIGGNAKASVISGGGSTEVKPSYHMSPYHGIVNALGNEVEVTYCEGARTFKSTPLLNYELVTEDGEQGWTAAWYNTGEDGLTAVGEALRTDLVDETDCTFSLAAPPGITRRWTIMLTGYLTPRTRDTNFDFGLTVAGRAKLFVDGELVIDNWTRQVRGTSFMGQGSAEARGIHTLKANKKHKITVHYVNVRGPADGDEDEAIMDVIPAVRLGGAEMINSDQMMAEAVKLAREADVAILVVGLDGEWESGGFDRITLALPGRSDELVAKVVAANPRTVVVTQSGSAIAMPWADTVPSLVHAWYLGNATGDAIADVLFGNVNPSGKLSLTFPRRLEDVPSHGHYHSENGKMRYAEDIFVGYKWYQHRKIEPAFPFGFGKSYTTFKYSNLHITPPTFSGDDITFSISATLTNTGTLSGTEVVQVYMSLPPTVGLTQTVRSLRGFSKVRDVGPGESRDITVYLDKYALSFWEERISRWVVDNGRYGVEVGSSSEDLPLVGFLEIDEVFEWNGL